MLILQIFISSDHHSPYAILNTDKTLKFPQVALAAQGEGLGYSSLHTIIERSWVSATDKEKYTTESLAYTSPSIQADEVIFECNKHTGQEALYVLRSFLAS